MVFKVPGYTPPDFNTDLLSKAPIVKTEAAPKDGVAPENYHATSNHPEYVHTGNGHWILAKENRMDCVMVFKNDTLDIVEARKAEERRSCRDRQN